MLGRRGELGRCAVTTSAEEGWICGTGSLRIRPSCLADSEFVAALLRIPGVRAWLTLQSVGSTMQNLNASIVGRIPVAVPDLAEQRRILDAVQSVGMTIDELLSQVRDAVDRLQELRAAIVSAAVTGAIDVRGCQSKA